MSYQQIAKDSRLKVLDLIHKAQTSHIGSNFSCADIMAVLFEKIDLDKDRFVLSAGWKAAILYYHLWRKGRITEEELDSYCQEGSKFIGLAEPVIPDIKIAGGSMGLGLPGAVGLALAKKLSKEPGIVVVLMSDGELQIGTFWESMLIAMHHGLDNLYVFVDENGLQAMGKTDDILRFKYGKKGKPKSAAQVIDELGPLVWHIDGHDYQKIEETLHWTMVNRIEANALQLTKVPTVVFCKTTKGKGVSFMENNNLYHYKQLSDEEYNKAKKELNGEDK